MGAISIGISTSRGFLQRGPITKGYGLKKGQDAVINSRQPGINQPSDLPVLIRRLKDIAGDIPIGVKIAAGKYLERNLELVVVGGVRRGKCGMRHQGFCDHLAG